MKYIVLIVFFIVCQKFVVDYVWMTKMDHDIKELKIQIKDRF